MNLRESTGIENMDIPILKFKDVSINQRYFNLFLVAGLNNKISSIS